MEDLFFSAVLADLNLIDKNIYLEKLDKYFLENPENKTLIELKKYSGDIAKSVTYICYYVKEADTKLYRKNLADYLEKLYHEMDLKPFSELCHEIWIRLPESMVISKYFLGLNIARDYVARGESEYAIRNFEEMFEFYKSRRFLDA